MLFEFTIILNLWKMSFKIISQNFIFFKLGWLLYFYSSKFLQPATDSSYYFLTPSFVIILCENFFLLFFRCRCVEIVLKRVVMGGKWLCKRRFWFRIWCSFIQHECLVCKILGSFKNSFIVSLNSSNFDIKKRHLILK